MERGAAMRTGTPPSRRRDASWDGRNERRTGTADRRTSALRRADSKASASSLSRTRQLHGSELSLTRRPATSSTPLPSCPAVQKAKAGVRACIEQMKTERNLHDARYTFSGLHRSVGRPPKKDIRWVVGQLQSLSEELTDLIREEQRALKQKPLPKIRKTEGGGGKQESNKQIKRQSTAPAISRKEPPLTPRRDHRSSPHRDQSSTRQTDRPSTAQNDPAPRESEPAPVRAKKEALPASKLKVPSPPKQRPMKKRNDELVTLLSNFLPLQRHERLLSRERFRDARSQTGFPASCASDDDSRARVELALRRTERLIERLNAAAEDLGFGDDGFGEGLLHVIKNFDDA